MAQSHPTPPLSVAMSSEEAQQAQDRVLVPETHTVTVQIGPHRFDLRPLTIKFAKQIKAILDPIALLTEQAKSSEDLLAAMGGIQDGYTKALCVLGQFYKLGLNAEWIEETLAAGEVRKLLEQQLELSRANDHLQLSLRQTLTVVAIVLEAPTAPPALSSGMPQSIPAFATPGDAPSPSSSSATPKAS